MANQSVSEKVMQCVQPIVEKLGYELVDVDYSKTQNGMVLTLYIYNEQGITLDDCEKVSRAIDEPLDELNPTNDVSYSLNISSLGLDRPIKSFKDALRNINKEVVVKLYSPLNGKKQFIGILSNCNEIGFDLLVDNETINFEYKKIALAQQNIKF